MFRCAQQSRSCSAGDITSRLAADTTTVSDQICLNVNVVVRSLTQAVIVLVFMLNASWRLTVITFIMLPATIFICRIYGAYFRYSWQQPESKRYGSFVNLTNRMMAASNCKQRLQHEAFSLGMRTIDVAAINSNKFVLAWNFAIPFPGIYFRFIEGSYLSKKP